MTSTLLQITDTHIHDDRDALYKNVHPDSSLSRVIQHAKKNVHHIDAVIVTGDLTNDGSEAACLKLAELLNQFDCPVYVTLGNHDFANIIQQHLLNDQISMPDIIRINNWQLLFADSHIHMQAEGTLTDTTLTRLNAQLQSCSDPALLFTHHPPVSVNSRWKDDIGLKNGAQALQHLCAHQHLHGLAFGHIHQYWHSQYRHIQILGTPSSCAQFKAGCDDFTLSDESPGYRLFQLHDNEKFSTEVIRIEQSS